MMRDNGLTVSGIPSPVTRPTNYMGDDPSTPDFEGFPDATTSAFGKGFTGNATNVMPRQGYLLFQHDKINTSNTTLFTSTNYTQALMTTYFYTIEKNGTVHQWDPVVKTKEYLDSNPTKVELSASIDIDFYFKR